MAIFLKKIPRSARELNPTLHFSVIFVWGREFFFFALGTALPFGSDWLSWENGPVFLSGSEDMREPGEGNAALCLF